MFSKEIGHFKEHRHKREKVDANTDVARVLAFEQVGESTELSPVSKIEDGTRVESEVRYVELKLHGTKFMGRLDFGPYITVTRRSVVPRTNLEHAGMIKLQGAFARSNGRPGVRVLSAICEAYWRSTLSEIVMCCHRQMNDNN